MITIHTRKMVIKENIEDFHLGNSKWTHTSIKTDPSIIPHKGRNMYFNPRQLLNCKDFIFWFWLFFLFPIFSWGFILLRLTTLWYFGLEQQHKKKKSIVFRTFNGMFHSMRQSKIKIPSCITTWQLYSEFGSSVTIFQRASIQDNISEGKKILLKELSRSVFWKW